jgi:hypothetical protein
VGEVIAILNNRKVGANYIKWQVFYKKEGGQKIKVILLYTALKVKA